MAEKKNGGLNPLLKTVALVGAIDYVTSGGFSLADRVRSWRSSAHLPERLPVGIPRSSYAPDVQARIDRARNGAPATVGGTRPSATGSGSGHWIRRQDGSRDAAIQRMIHDDFPRERVASLLRRMRTPRGRKSVASELGIDQTQIPAIYEWLCALAWFWISDRVYDVEASIGVHLDQRNYPVACANAGHGDIAVNYRHGDAVLIEASLMNLHNQRRNEWEPAIRHSADLSAELRKDVRTIFVAPELDTNTVNIWRGVASSTVTASDGTRIRCRILPVTSDMLADWVEGGVTSSHIEEVIDETYRADTERDFDMGWWDKATSAV